MSDKKKKKISTQIPVKGFVTLDLEIDADETIDDHIEIVYDGDKTTNNQDDLIYSNVRIKNRKPKIAKESM